MAEEIKIIKRTEQLTNMRNAMQAQLLENEIKYQVFQMLEISAINDVERKQIKDKVSFHSKEISTLNKFLKVADEMLAQENKEENSSMIKAK
jgi:hypothetical protein